MKTLSLSLILFFSILLAIPKVETPAQNSGANIIDNIKVAIRAGSSSQLSQYLYDPVELNLDEKRESYSRNQAEFVLRDFFTKYKVKDFSYIHQGSSKEGLQYVIGKYEYNGGAFQVYMLLKKVENGSEMRVSMVDFSEDS